jgi:CHAT domain-containing protein
MDKDSAAVEEALRDAYEAAVAYRHPDVVIAGGNWLFYCASHDRWEEAAAVGERTMAVVEQLVHRQTHQHYKRVVLRDAARVVGRTAYALVRVGRPADAAVMLERSQAVVLTDRYVKPLVIEQALRASGHRDLALEYTATADVFHNHNASDEALRQAEDRLAALTEQLSDLPGVAALIQKVDAATVAANTAGTVVVYLTASRFGGLALVTYGDGEFRGVELPEATEQQVERVAARFMQRVVAPNNPPMLRARTIAATCDWLGRAIMNVLTRELGACAPVLLIPTGKLVGLPFHAAQAARTGDVRYALADRQYSYAPTAALIGSPVDLSERSLTALVVAEPARGADQGIAGVDREVDAVARAFARSRVLFGPAATRDTVVAALRQAGLAHLACHAVSDPDEPMRSAMLLAGKDILRLEELLADPVKDLRLTVLSACQTAVTDRDLPGESLSLAAGLRAVGAQGVIGSLWPVWSDATAVLMERFYDGIATGVTPAEALRQAQLALATGAVEAPPTDETGMAWSNPYYWAGFVYFGR